LSSFVANLAAEQRSRLESELHRFVRWIHRGFLLASGETLRLSNEPVPTRNQGELRDTLGVGLKKEEAVGERDDPNLPARGCLPGFPFHERHAEAMRGGKKELDGSRIPCRNIEQNRREPRAAGEEDRLFAVV
jgi:hypothetical protein